VLFIVIFWFGQRTVAGSEPILNISKFIEKNFDHELFDYQLKNYQSAISSLGRNMLLQTVAIYFCLKVLFTKDVDHDIPVHSLKIKRTWLRYILPFAMLCLWLQFGFNLNEAIKSRHLAWLTLTSSNSPEFQPDSVKLKSLAALFEDNGFVDGWFELNLPREHAIETQHFMLLFAFYIIGFGLLLSLAHGCCIALAYVASQRNARQQRPYEKYLQIMPYVYLLAILFSHFWFRFSGGNENLLQPIIFALTAGFIYLLLDLHDSKLNKTKKSRGARLPQQAQPGR
jgi:hypothetical protein